MPPNLGPFQECLHVSASPKWRAPGPSILPLNYSLVLGFHLIRLLLIQNMCPLHVGVGDKTEHSGDSF